MKIAALLIVVLLSTASALHAAGAPEFERLQTSYQTAVEKAMKPLNETYLADLQRLRDGYTRAGNLEGANRVQAEITAVNQAAAYAKLAKKAPTAALPANTAAAASSAASVSTSAKMPELRWFVGKTWLTGAKTKWSFEKDGTGDKMRGNDKIAIFTWRVLPSGLVELSERAGPGKPASIMYLQFKDKSEAWFGTTETKLTERLHYE